ncbi:hypothetical protein B7494_g2797 [Chlorociboria aeruginascens]|nr:hypothetical protein B7494_g2797 [Chlorociboria aeruginascens]
MEFQERKSEYLEKERSLMKDVIEDAREKDALENMISLLKIRVDLHKNLHTKMVECLEDINSAIDKDAATRSDLDANDVLGIKIDSPHRSHHKYVASKRSNTYLPTINAEKNLATGRHKQSSSHSSKSVPPPAPSPPLNTRNSPPRNPYRDSYAAPSYDDVPPFRESQRGYTNEARRAPGYYSYRTEDSRQYYPANSRTYDPDPDPSRAYVQDERYTSRNWYDED